MNSPKSQFVDGPKGVPRGVEFFSKEEEIKEATLLAHIVPAQQRTGSGVVEQRLRGLIAYLD